MMLALAHGFEFDHAPAEEVSVLAAPPPGARVSCTKLPREVLLAEALLAADPEQWFVYLQRDPRDVIVSKHKRAPDKYWVSLYHVRRARERAARVHGHPRFIEVRYEELVRAPDAVQEKLHQRMPFLVRRGRFSEFHRDVQPSAQTLRATRGIRPVDTDSIGAWRRHKPRVVGQIAQHGSLTPDLVALGYEPDASWERELEGVEPDLAPGFGPERDESENMRRWEQGVGAELERYLRARGLTRS